MNFNDFNIREIVILIKELIEPYEGTQPEVFSLSQPALWGLIRLLDCANGALAFEEQFRFADFFSSLRASHGNLTKKH